MMYKCKFCDRQFNRKEGSTYHSDRCPTNPNRIRGTFFGRKHTAEALEKISNGMKGNRNANHRGDRQSYYNGIRMDSKWEVGTAKYLDSVKIDWKYGVKGFRLSDGRYYYPDFFIYKNNNFERLIEVKGYFREDNRKKFDMFLKEYPDIQIDLWQRPKLFELGIIDREGYIKD